MQTIVKFHFLIWNSDVNQVKWHKSHSNGQSRSENSLNSQSPAEVHENSQHHNKTLMALPKSYFDFIWLLIMSITGRVIEQKACIKHKVFSRLWLEIQKMAFENIKSSTVDRHLNLFIELALAHNYRLRWERINFSTQREQELTRLRWEIWP